MIHFWWKWPDSQVRFLHVGVKRFGVPYFITTGLGIKLCKRTGNRNFPSFSLPNRTLPYYVNHPSIPWHEFSEPGYLAYYLELRRPTSFWLPARYIWLVRWCFCAKHAAVVLVPVQTFWSFAVQPSSREEPWTSCCRSIPMYYIWLASKIYFLP